MHTSELAMLDEIKRLQTVNSALKEQSAMWEGKAIVAEQEIERLQAIIDRPPGSCDGVDAGLAMQHP